jgi:hypothetical protein
VQLQGHQSLFFSKINSSFETLNLASEDARFYLELFLELLCHSFNALTELNLSTEVQRFFPIIRFSLFTPIGPVFEWALQCFSMYLKNTEFFPPEEA